VTKELKNTSSFNYVDLLILTLTQHEKNLSLIIEKLEQISEKLEIICKQFPEPKKSL